MHLFTTTEDETRYDHLDAIEAIAISWSCREGDPHWHELMQGQVRKANPKLARALDRLVAER